MNERPDIVSAIDAYMAKQIKLWTVKANRASQIGDPCLRKLVYYRLYPELQELPGVDQAALPQVVPQWLVRQ